MLTANISLLQSFFLRLCYEINVVAFEIYILLILDLIQEDSCLSNQHLFNYNFFGIPSAQKNPVFCVTLRHYWRDSTPGPAE